MHVVFCSSEVFPFAKTGGLADVCGSLPIALEKLGIEMTIVLPGYRAVGSGNHAREKVTENLSRTSIGKNIRVYFIENKKYFDREGLYGDRSGDHPDNIERFSYYCRETLAVLKQLDLKPDIIHCHDWQTALIPVYLKEKYGSDEFYAGTKTVLTIHNLAFQGIFPKDQFEKLGLNEKLFDPHGFEFYGKVNLIKAGIMYSDRITTVSPQYAAEIRTKKFGCGLDDVLKERYDGVIGILNGLDHDIWNPAKDGFIARNYTADNFAEAKWANKTQLQKELGFEVSKEVPLFGFVGRLSEQKGIDLIIEAAGDLVNMGAQLVCLGMGESRYEEQLTKLTSRYPANISASFEFNDPLGHQIYAGSDFFLMPSRFEPCGLTQMISLYYGTIPVVFKIGGLADTIKPFRAIGGAGNGFVFNKYTKTAFVSAIKRAVQVFRQEERLEHLRKNALHSDFSWTNSAKKYQEIYSNVGQP